MRVVEMMFMIALILPGILLMATKEKNLIKEFLPNEKVPPFWARMVNHLIIAVIFAILGVFFYRKAGFLKPSFDGLNITSLLVGLICSLVHIAYYYLFFIKKVDPQTNAKVEFSRKQLGILTRLFYGGIVEEVIFRFGIMSFLVWLAGMLIKNVAMAFWLGNIVAAALFALAHLPAIFQMKVTVTKTILIYFNSMNIMVGLCCGWLYWTQGFAAAVLCHMLFHLVWYVFEKGNKAAAPHTFHLSED